MEEQTVRLNKHLANLGLCARRDVNAFLKREYVTINGKRATEQGIRIDLHHDDIKINGEKIKPPKLEYYLLNKPKGIISTTADEYGRKNVLSLIPSKERVYPVGRLDKETSGLLLLTNDGTLTNQLIHPKYHVNKVYRLTIAGKVNPAQLKALRNGVLLTDGITAPARVTVIKERSNVSMIEMTIHEGRNRQIRRMCETVGIRLLDLQRIRFGPLTVQGLGIGKFRKLTQEEIHALRKMSSSQQKREISASR